MLFTRNCPLLLLGLALLLARPCAASVSPSTAPLRSVQAIHLLSNQEAARSLPVEFEAIVTYYRRGNVDLFVQEADVAIYVETTTAENLITGDRVLIRGVTRDSFRPEVKSSEVKVLGHGLPPAAVPATFRQLIHAELDCRRVTLRGIVRSANSILDYGAQSTYLQIMVPGGTVDAEVFGAVTSQLPDLLDAEVELTGAAAGKFDTRMQMTGILLEVPSLSDLKILKLARRKTSSMPVTPMNEILSGYNVENRSLRIRVQGTVTYFQQGSAAVLQDGDKSLWITTQSEAPLRIGEFVDATGFPDVVNGSLTLTNAAIERTGVFKPLDPKTVTAAELARGTEASRLVSVTGRVLMSIREAAQDEYVLVFDNHLFSAVLRHPNRALNVPLPPLKQLPAGALVRMTGVCNLDRGDLYEGSVAFEILLRAQDDIAVIAQPSWLNVRNLVQLIGLLLLIVLGIGTRAWLIERGLRNKASRMMKVEQKRSEILAQINRSMSLEEILEQITQLVTLSIPVAKCWCVLEGGERMGHPPADTTQFLVLEASIGARSGKGSGILYAALPKTEMKKAADQEALSSAAELATVAIETSRTYSDLLRRSQFDLLTGLHNRFSVEKSLEALADPTADVDIQGIIYLDLDSFKEVNDTYGHQLGDVYLQEVAARMKSQIRPTDLLARFGGDEFAVVVSGARKRGDVDEIASRLTRCFDRPFKVEGQDIRGSVSCGVAYFPDDGTTKESLFKAADRAMYRNKRTKRVTVSSAR